MLLTETAHLHQQGAEQADVGAAHSTEHDGQTHGRGGLAKFVAFTRHAAARTHRVDLVNEDD